MREFDSPSLRNLHRILKISTGPPQLVDIQDDVLQQMIGVNPFMRRELTPQGSSGIFTASILNTHTGSDTITTDVNPYTPGTTFVDPTYGDPVDPDLDVWLIMAHAQVITGDGDFGDGFLSIIMDATAMGWRNEASAIAVNQIIQAYDSERPVGSINFLYSSGTDVLFLSTDGGTPIRISREGDARIRFQTIKAGVGAATYKLFLTLGLFPVGMGQDVL